MTLEIHDKRGEIQAPLDQQSAEKIKQEVDSLLDPDQRARVAACKFVRTARRVTSGRQSKSVLDFVRIRAVLFLPGVGTGEDQQAAVTSLRDTFGRRDAIASHDGNATGRDRDNPRP